MKIDIFNTNKKYRVIYADPPYQYRNVRTGGSMKSGSAQKYPVMKTEDICKLPVNKIGGNDSVLFLWSTVPMLEDALKILHAWGYEYKTAIFWRKIMSLGMGFWFRGQVELCLLGVKGKVKPFRLQKPNFIQTKALRHSQKPEEMRQLIEATGLQPRIELFARQPIEGWDCYGDEI
jgi:site-specific DNA-methyltransferase (adenine-specific)